LLFIRNIVLAFLPALLIGVIAYEAIRAAIQTPMVVAVALIVGGVAILLIERTVRKVRVTRIEEISIRSAAAGELCDWPIPTRRRRIRSPTCASTGSGVVIIGS